MKRIKITRSISALLVVCITLTMFQGCASSKNKIKNKIKVGFLVDALWEERWARDMELFTANARALKADVFTKSAGGKKDLQEKMAKELIKQGVDVLVVVPNSSESAKSIVDIAHKYNIKVVAYDRMIRDCQLDYYVSFDSKKVGELQANYLVKKYPKGNYILVGGSEEDDNAKLLNAGQHSVLDPYIKRGDIRIVSEKWTEGWDPAIAYANVSAALIENDNNITAVLASNDGCAGTAFQALSEHKLAGRTGLTGQDADIAACQRIVEGTQSMTVYKPIEK
ncbi:MAG: substrate-binding domain-containing protein, partial [Bacillota bacterium]|nr:substrate-binding domain-containing protein [Bacillota bacterium]